MSSHWRTAPLSDIFDVKGGKRVPLGESLLNTRTSYPYIRVTDFHKGSVNLDNIKYITKEIFDSIKNYTITTKDLYISVAGTLGLVGTVPKELNGANLTENANKLVPKNKSITDINFYKFYLSSDLIQSQIFQQKGTGGGVPKLAVHRIQSMEVLIPPLPEQKKIAEILTSVDRVIELTSQEIDKLKDLRRGMMQELLTKGIGHTKFKDSPVGKIPESWEIVDLDTIKKDRFGIVDGPFGSNLKTEHYKLSGIPVMQSGFVTSNIFLARKYVYVDEIKFEEQKRSLIEQGDILMAKIGAQCGTCAIVPLGHPIGILAGNSMRLAFNPTKATNEFILLILHYLFDLGQIDRLKTVTAQPALSITSLKNMEIGLPTLEEQQEIVNNIKSIETNILNITNKLNGYFNLKKGLMNDLLSGKVRVKV